MSKLNTEEEIKIFEKLMDSFSEPRRTKVNEMINKIGDRYFTSPGSYRVGLHDCYPGGLLHHSLNVTKNFQKLCDLWGSEVLKDTRLLCGLFHDLGKIGTINGELLYTPAQEKWKIDKGQLYDYNAKLPDGLSHAQRSIRILTHFGIEITDEEYLAILAHDGMYLEENKVHKESRSKLTFLLHAADYYTYIE
jgi:hypothetical protein